MSSDEEARLDTTGRFVEVVVDGNKRNDVEWRRCRIVLSNKRLVLATAETKDTIVLSEVTAVKRAGEQSSAETASGYLSLQAGTDVTLVAPADVDAFERELYDALIDRATVLVQHPVVVGGVVQDAVWETGRVSATGSRVDLAIASGTFVEIRVDDVAHVAATDARVQGTERRVIEVEHADEETSVETHLAGDLRTTSLLASFLRRGAERNTPDVELSDAEIQVLMALYSGVSPFEVPDFVGVDVDRIEAIYDRLIDEGVLEPVGTRRDVQLEARGRSIATDEVGDG